MCRFWHDFNNLGSAGRWTKVVCACVWLMPIMTEIMVIMTMMIIIYWFPSKGRVPNQNVVSEGIPIVYVYQMHQQNGSFAQNVDSEDIPGSTNGVNKKARNNKLYGDRAPPTSTNVLIYKMGWPPRLQFLAPFHISCNPDINKVGNRSYMEALEAVQI